MKMFRSDQRKDFRHDLTEEELEELRARRRISPGKISGTMGVVYMPHHAAEQVEEPWASDWRRRTDQPYEDRHSGRTGSGDDDVAWRPEAASMRSAAPSTRGASSASTPIQGKGLDEVRASELDLAVTGSGEPLPDDLRADMEAFLGMDFVGGRDDPAEREADDAAERAVAEGERPTGTLVEDGAETRPGQMTKSALLAKLQAAAEAELSAIPPESAEELRRDLTARLDEYRSKDAASVERAVAEATNVSAAESARDLVAAAREQMHGNTRASSADGEGRAASPDVAAAAGAVQRRPDSSPGGISARLGAGEPLDSATAGTIGGAYGESFADVRVHTDSDAAQMAAEQGALAFTVGRHIAFAPGQYRPGSIEGDALLAHELAHVVQQGGAEADESGEVQRKPAASDAGHEADADEAAAGALARMYRGARNALAELGERVRPALRSGLAVQRCQGNNQQQLQQRVNQLTQELQTLINEAHWRPNIRERMYAQLGQPIRQRAGQRGQGNLQDLTGIGSQLAVGRFVSAIRAVQGQWSQLSPQQRATAVFNAANAELQQAAVFPMKTVVVRQMTPQGTFSSSRWQFAIREQIVNNSNLSDDAAARMADVTLHEARHCEQSFRVARYLAGQGQTARQIQNAQGIPADVVQAAVAAPLTAQTGSAQELQEAQEWEQAYGAQGAQHAQTSQNVLTQITELDTRRGAAERALTALQANPSLQTYQAAVRARDRLRAQITAVENAYRAYRNIPYEADSHEVGVTADEAFRNP